MLKNIVERESFTQYQATTFTPFTDQEQGKEEFYQTMYGHGDHQHHLRLELDQDFSATVPEGTLVYYSERTLTKNTYALLTRPVTVRVSPRGQIHYKPNWMELCRGDDLGTGFCFFFYAKLQLPKT